MDKDVWLNKLLKTIAKHKEEKLEKGEVVDLFSRKKLSSEPPKEKKVLTPEQQEENRNKAKVENNARAFSAAGIDSNYAQQTRSKAFKQKCDRTKAKIAEDKELDAEMERNKKNEERIGQIRDQMKAEKKD